MILTISPSSLESLQECPTKYEYSSIRRLTLIDEKRDALDRGSLFHKLLEVHYKCVMTGDIKLGDIILAVTQFARELYQNDEYDDVQMVEECIKNYQEYAMFWKDDGWIPLAIESPFSKVLYEDEQHKIIIEGKRDLIVKNASGTIIPVDHKTTSKIEYVNPLSNQFMAYVWVDDGSIFIKNEIGFQKSKGPGERFHRHPLNYDKANLEEWRENTIYDCMKLISYIENDHFPRRYSNCWRCRFGRICETTPDSREFKMKALYKVREAYDLYGD